MRDIEDSLAERIDELGKQIALMPFGEEKSPERRERDRLCDLKNRLEATLTRIKRTRDE